jgi:Centromere DNA-binding protein complex CBF3 subunit, domain 2
MRHPNDVNITLQMQRSVTQLNECFRPTNTAKAHEPKIEEFFQFCDMVYPTDPYKYNIAFEKVYRFMYYQAFRPLKKRGGGGGGRKRKRQRRSTPTKVSDDDGDTVDGIIDEVDVEVEEEITMRFSKDLYDEVMVQYNGSPPSSPAAETDLPLQSLQPLSWSSFDQYKQVIRRIYKVQKQERVCSLDWDAIWQEPLEELAKQVKGRKQYIKRITYQEKVSAEFAPYTIVERYQDIEEEFWRDSSKAVGPRQIACQLRHRYCIQHTSSGVLRCESLHRAEFSDFICIKVPKTDTDIHPVEIMVNQIAQGKTNKGRLIYGRAIRHRDVRLCCIGALSFYLQYRLYVTNEFKDMTVEDWFDNKKWFDIKLLSDVYGESNMKEMSKDTYGPHVKAVLKRLGIPFSKRLHIGRNFGAKCLELLEEEQEAIKQMGQWNQAMFDIAYSAKLPMGPMRKLAGFHGGNKMYFNTRTVEMPLER